MLPLILFVWYTGSPWLSYNPHFCT